jgi:hypothetical protein
LESRKSFADLSGGKDLVGQMMGVGAAFGSAEDDAVRRPDHQPARLEEQLGLTGVFEFIPQGVSPLNERHITRMFKIRFANNAGLAMRRSMGMRRSEPIEPRDAPAGAGQMVNRSAAHGAEPGDDDVVMVRHQRRIMAGRVRAKAHSTQDNSRSTANGREWTRIKTEVSGLLWSANRFTRQ